MKIRTQLLVAFLLLSVLPLAGIVAWTFLSSRAALREAFEAEAAAAAADMQGRLESATRDVESRLARLGERTTIRILEGPDAAAAGRQVGTTLLRELGAAAPFLEGLQIVPEAPLPPDPAAVPAPPAAPEAPPVEIRIPELDPEDQAELEAAMEELGGLGSIGRIVEVSVLRALEAAEQGLEAEANEDGDGPADGAPSPEEIAGLEEARHTLARIRREMDGVRAIRDAARTRDRMPALAPRADGDLPPSFEVPLTEEGRVVGRLRGRLRAGALVERVLAASGREAGEIPFAIDAEGQLLTADEEDRPVLEPLPLAGETGVATWRDEWVVARQRDAATGATVGIVRPIGEPLRNMRRTAVRNFALGQAIVLLALLAVLLLSGRMTRQVRAIAEGAERVARGDLQTRVPVRTRNELGQLAASFNRMAEDLSRQQQRLVEEEMRRRENELQQEMLRREYDRKSSELEDARRFQLSLLPKRLPRVAGLDLAVHTKTAAEVGGDYYDFREEDGALVVAIGDATGHGARAGTMVTIVKSLFSARPLDALPEFLDHANRSIRSMELGRMAMALALVRFRGRRVTLASAGMPPLLVHRAATGRVEEVGVPGTPLGSLLFEYRERETELEPGDTVLLMSDGHAELLDGDGETFGYERTERELAAACAAGGGPREVLRALLDAGDRWTGGEPIRDDVTFLVVRVG